MPKKPNELTRFRVQEVAIEPTRMLLEATGIASPSELYRIVVLRYFDKIIEDFGYNITSTVPSPSTPTPPSPSTPTPPSTPPSTQSPTQSPSLSDPIEF